MKPVFEHRGDLFVSRCQKHVVFHWCCNGEAPLILALFHERMDLMVQLKERLEELAV
ncbi:MAG: type II toxin-antitoxin system RelE/ParE family toxin [Verrucomicrobiota bacterium]